MATPGKLTYVHGRVMRFVPGEPFRAYSAGKLRNTHGDAGTGGGVRRYVVYVHYAPSSLRRAWKISKFLSRKVVASHTLIRFAAEYELDARQFRK